MSFVLKSWVSEVGLKMQSILISGMRGPDFKNKAIKDSVRWMRANCLVDADPRKQSYMKSVSIDADLIIATLDELQYARMHYVKHFADALAVIAYFHEESEVRNIALNFYALIATELFHFKPETEQEFRKRHKDTIDEFREI